MSINQFTDGELITAPRMNAMVDQLNTRYYVVDETVGRTVKVWDYLNGREQMIYGDTGRRNIAGQALAGVTASEIILRRSGSTVLVAVGSAAYTGVGAGNIDFVNLPSGFKPESNLYGQTFRAKRYGFNTSGRVYVTDPTSSVDYFYATYTTSDPWPTTLPGVAA